MPKYIRPTMDWAPLLKTIVKDVQPGVVIETYTDSMYDLLMEELRAAERTDIDVHLLHRETVKMASPDDHH